MAAPGIPSDSDTTLPGRRPPEPQPGRKARRPRSTRFTERWSEARDSPKYSAPIPSRELLERGLILHRGGLGTAVWAQSSRTISNFHGERTTVNPFLSEPYHEAAQRSRPLSLWLHPLGIRGCEWRETGLRGPEAAQGTQHPALESPSFRARMGGDPLPPYTPSFGEGESDGSGAGGQGVAGASQAPPESLDRSGAQG